MEDNCRLDIFPCTPIDMDSSDWSAGIRITGNNYFGVCMILSLQIIEKLNMVGI